MVRVDTRQANGALVGGAERLGALRAGLVKRMGCQRAEVVEQAEATTLHSYIFHMSAVFYDARCHSGRVVKALDLKLPPMAKYPWGTQAIQWA